MLIMCICTLQVFLMPRHKKPRHCECESKGRAYKPTGIPLGKVEKVALYRDEIETLILCDREGFTQEEAGARMGVSRGTVQRILSNARKKVADALSGCKALVLEDSICKEKEGTSSAPKPEAGKRRGNDPGSWKR
jgi:predicted DNA-binding protein (UPF0251 family)